MPACCREAIPSWRFCLTEIASNQSLLQFLDGFLRIVDCPIRARLIHEMAVDWWCYNLKYPRAIGTDESKFGNPLVIPITSAFLRKSAHRAHQVRGSVRGSLVLVTVTK